MRDDRELTYLETGLMNSNFCCDYLVRRLAMCLFVFAWEENSVSDRCTVNWQEIDAIAITTLNYPGMANVF